MSKYTPDYGDESDDARLFWLRRELIEREREAKGHGVASVIQEYAQERLPRVREEIARLEGPPLRVIDGARHDLVGATRRMADAVDRDIRGRIQAARGREGGNPALAHQGQGAGRSRGAVQYVLEGQAPGRAQVVPAMPEAKEHRQSAAQTGDEAP